MSAIAISSSTSSSTSTHSPTRQHAKHQHPLTLTRNPYPKGRCICDGCGSNISSDDNVYHCSPCHYDLCLSCMGPPPTIHLASHPHDLTYHSSVFGLYPSSYFICNLCEKHNTGSTWQCSECQYDVCTTCYEIVSIIDQQDMSSPKTTTSTSTSSTSNGTKPISTSTSTSTSTSKGITPTSSPPISSRSEAAMFEEKLNECIAHLIDMGFEPDACMHAALYADCCVDRAILHLTNPDSSITSSSSSSSLSLSSSSSVSVPDEPETCVICLDSEKCVVLIPCAHSNVCGSCVTALRSKYDEPLCPACRIHITGVIEH